METGKTTKMQSFTRLQDLKELKDILLDGIKSVEPRAIECIPGTRTSILDDIITKTDDWGGANTIWIRGAPGSGKSSISLTAKSRLCSQGQLITYYRFDRNEASTTTPTALWRRVAYDLARRLPPLRLKLLKQLRNDTVDLDSAVVIFNSLIEVPLSKLTKRHTDRPLIVVIDAIDECGGLAGPLSPDRQILLQTLRRWSKLPKCFKILFTSRPEGDITRILASISTPIDIPSGYFLTEYPQAKASIDSSNDIQLFLESRFQATRQRFPSLPPGWPGLETIIEMVRRAAGLFMWATTAANFIDLGMDPRHRLHNIMDDPYNSSSMRPLYSLYAIVLEIAFGEIPDGGPEAEILRSVLAAIVLAKRPLDNTEFTKLPTTEPITAEALDTIRDGLRSVITPGRFRFVHKSFDDFLLSTECPPKFAIKKDESHYLITKLCLTTMTEGLQFNMCGLDTSCLKNTDVPDIEVKVANGIPPLLSYSCCFIADHLGLTPFDQCLLSQVKEMIMDKLLYWFEALSLLKEMNRVSHSLLAVLKWSHPSSDNEFKHFLHDARRFVGAFIHPIAQSAPHIYISALPFAPEYSFVAKHFFPRFPWTLALATGQPTNWSPCLFTSEHHEGIVSCIAFSPDEKCFASGSHDMAIRVYDSETGNLISGPFTSDDEVYYVFFDSDGHHVWASYIGGEMVCWDIKTGDKRLAFNASEDASYYASYCCFNGCRKVISAGKTAITLWNAENGTRELRLEHGYNVTQGSISPDGCYIAYAGRDDRIVRFWRVMDGNTIQGPSEDRLHFQSAHTRSVLALSFSASSKFVVSGSEDGTILLWDARTGDTIGCPLDTKAEVNAVAYSPENHLLISSSGGTGVVTVWNALTHEAVLGPLKNHTSSIFEIVLSRDGRKALTASGDWTLRMWDLGRKEVVSATNDNGGHTAGVWCVAFSPCGNKLASVGVAEGIRVWDVNRPGTPLLKCTYLEKYSFKKIIFSPDGRQIVAYDADDGAVLVWNLVTGELAFHLDLSDDNCSVEHVSFQSSDERLVLCSSSGVVRIWSWENHFVQVVAKLAKILTLSPNGLVAVLRDDNKSPRHYLWNTTIYQPFPLTFTNDKHISDSTDDGNSEVTRVCSTNGRLLASIHNVNEGASVLRVWNTRTGKLVAGPSTFNDSVFTLALAPNDEYVALACYTSSRSPVIWVYDVRTGRALSGPWSGHSDDVYTLAFSPDARKLASGSWDRQIRVWNTVDLLGDPQTSVCLVEAGEYMERDGWVKGTDGKLLFWIPKDHRTRLVWPQNTLIDGCRMTTKLDMSRFRYGERWTECFGDRS